jgi:hypothetical protein
MVRPAGAYAGLGHSAERADFAARFVRPKSKPALLGYWDTKSKPAPTDFWDKSKATQAASRSNVWPTSAVTTISAATAALARSTRNSGVESQRCCSWCYTGPVPTRHPRHSVTETPPVREALDALRLRGERVRMGDLVIRGARERLRELEAERDDEAERAELRRQLVERLRTGEGIDVDAAYEVREHGWIHR